MKKLLILACCLAAVACKRPNDDKFIGKWTDGHYRHISINTAKDGYVVDDISNGGKIYPAKRLGDELIVTTETGISIFNYLKATDGLFAGQVNLHRE